MTQRIPLKPSDHDCNGDRYVYCYDESSEMEFDFEEKTKPDSKDYQQHDGFFEGNDSLFYPPLVLPSVAFADLNLRTRGLIGVVLGSVAKYLTTPPENLQELNNHRDLDVLILSPHSPHHPAPNEWNVDWFVRPPNGAPTNGRVELWYDLGLASSVETGSAETGILQPGPLSLDVNNKEVVYDPSLARKYSLVRETRDQVEKIILPPGLYLLDAQAFRQLIRHCNKKAEQLQYAETHGKMKFNQNRLMKLANRFRLGKIGTMELLGELPEIRQAFKEICMHHDVDWPDGADSIFDQLFLMAAKGNPAPFKEEIGSHLSKLEDIFKHHNWDYLDLKKVDTRNALYPMLPSELLTFKPL